MSSRADRPLLALLIAAAAAVPAGAQTGTFAGALDNVPLTLQTDTGPRGSTGDGDLVVTVSEAGGVRSAALGLANLVASEVTTGSGASGVVGFTLSASGTAPIHPTTGQVTIPVTLSVHYPLIDHFFPPTPNPNAPGDAPQPFLETFVGTLSGTLAFQAATSSYSFTGALQATVTGTATGKVLSLELGLTALPLLPDDAAAALLAGGELAGCPAERRCKEMKLKICPVRIRAGSGDTSPTGASQNNQIERAREVWRQCCIELEVAGTRTVTAAALKELTAAGGTPSAEEQDLLGRVDERSCVEVFFTGSFDPRHSHGDGFTTDRGTAGSKVVVADDGDATDSRLLAHELGHALGLPHPRPASVPPTVMDPSGQPPPNPPGQNAFRVNLDQCKAIRQPLLRRTDRDCCKVTCESGETTPPTCRRDLGASGDSLVVIVQDVDSGLRSIEVLNETNTSRDKGGRVRGFVNGSKDPFTFTTDKTDPELPSSITFAVKDVCGNVTVCDPAIALVVREPGKPAEQTVTGLPAEERWVEVRNHTPGIRHLLVTVNGTPFRINGLRDGEQRLLDIASALLPGPVNTVTLSATGKPGGGATVVISD